MNLVTTLARRLHTAFKVAAEPIGQHMRLYHHIPMPLLVLVLARMWRLIARFDRLVLTYERGQLPTPRTRPRRQTAPKPPTPQLRLPTGHGWLGKLLPAAQGGAAFLDVLLQEPDGEARALVAAAPQAGRLLRPLCRIFGVTPPEWLRLPKRPRKPRPPKPPRPESRTALNRRLRAMTTEELRAWFHPIPPHFPLAIPRLRELRRKTTPG